MNFKRKLLIFLISFFLIIPINALAYSKYLIPGGENIGIKVFSDGVYIVGFYKVDNHLIAYDAGFRVGDRIVSINSEVINNVMDLVDKMDSDQKELDFEVGFIRNNKFKTINMKLKQSDNGSYKTGLYVKDSITGIGTLTYINPSNNSFGALGHEIADSNTNVSFMIDNGFIYASKVESITKSKNGEPGEKNAKIDNKKIYGKIKKNEETGIYGKLDGNDLKKNEFVEVATMDEVKIGKAEIITVLGGTKKEYYDIEILSIDKKNPTKNFFIKIVDERLLNECGGIVKGMSGSPIMQNGKIIGAVTHTMVDNPKKGYGISIIKMLESEE